MSLRLQRRLGEGFPTRGMKLGQLRDRTLNY